MKQAEAQHSRAQNPAPVRQEKSTAGIESPQGEQIAQLEAMMDSSPQAAKLTQLAAMMNSSPAAAAQRKLADMMHNSPRIAAQRKFVEGIENSPYLTAQRQKIESQFGGVAQRREAEEPLQQKTATAQLEQQPAKPNNTGLPDNLKSGIESLSGISMDNVKVHYNSSQPAQLNALAYAQGTDIHVAPGQEKHLPHEAWHVVQQAQGRVQPTMQMKGGVPVNDDAGLEREADVMGDQAVQMKGRRPMPGTYPADHDGQSPDITQRQRMLYAYEVRQAGLAGGAAGPLQRIIKFKKEGMADLDENNINKHKEEILKSNPKLQEDKKDDVWSEIVEMARDEFEDHKIEDGGYEKLVELVMRKLEIYPSDDEAKEEDDDEGGIVVCQLLIDLKHIWVKISKDPTENHTETFTLGVLALELGEKMEEISKFGLWPIPGLQVFKELGDEFIKGEYTCHHGVTTKAKAAFSHFDFAEVVNGNVTAPKKVEVVLGKWDAEVFSSRV